MKMTNKEAIRILNEQRNKFMDEWVDFSGVNEAYNIAIQALKEQEAIKPSARDGANGFGFVWTCGACGEDLYPNNKKAKYCSCCRQAVMWE